MADRPYRAVFLRVHPTGKMVLSLTTEADGNEGGYADLVAGALGVPSLDVKVVPADTDPAGIHRAWEAHDIRHLSVAVRAPEGALDE